MERWGLRWNLIAATMTATAAIVLTILLLEDPLTDYRLSRTQRLDLQDAVMAAETELKHQRDPDSIAEGIGARFGTWIVDFAGWEGRRLDSLRSRRLRAIRHVLGPATAAWR